MINWYLLASIIAIIFMFGLIIGFLLCAIGMFNSLAEDEVDLQLVAGKWTIKKE